MSDQAETAKVKKPSDFPIRITTCIALDQAEALAATKKRLHTSESPGRAAGIG